MRSIITLALALSATFTSFAQWVPLTTGQLSNRSMTNDGTANYVAAYTHGVNKALNGSSTWGLVNTGLPMSGSTVYVQSVGWNGSYLFAGTESGIYRSNNGGSNWTAANGTLTASSTVYANKFYTFGGITMAAFAGTIAAGGGVYRTNNNGNTWNIGHSGMGSNVEVYNLTNVGTTLWASTSTGLWKSIDNGLNWSAWAPVNYTVYALTSWGTRLVIISTFGIRYSTDGGTVWTDATGDVNNPTKGELIAFDGKVFALLPAPTGCERSLDGGATWTAYNTGFSVVDAQAQEEFYDIGYNLYCTALFDVYSITGTSTSVQEALVGGLRIAPTVFTEGFTLVGAPAGELRLIDAVGRTARSMAINANDNTWIDRGDLANGTYQVLVIDRTSGVAQHIGRVVAY